MNELYEYHRRKALDAALELQKTAPGLSAMLKQRIADLEMPWYRRLWRWLRS